MISDAYFSADRLYRYWLFRYWNPNLPFLALIGCNPSVAAEVDNDHTIRKEIGFAEKLGFGGIFKLNVGAFIATDPKEWKAARDPFGPENTIGHIQDHLQRISPGATVACWGRPCTASQRGAMRAEEIKRRIIGLQCFGRNGDGSPRHPLMLSYETPLEPFNY